MTWQCKNADFIYAFDDFVDLSIVVFYIAISNNDGVPLISMNFAVKSSIKEKPRCAGKTGTVEDPPSASNVRLRFVKPESESLDIRQTRIQVPGVEYSIC